MAGRMWVNRGAGSIVERIGTWECSQALLTCFEQTGLPVDRVRDYNYINYNNCIASRPQIDEGYPLPLGWSPYRIPPISLEIEIDLPIPRWRSKLSTLAFHTDRPLFHLYVMRSSSAMGSGRMNASPVSLTASCILYHATKAHTECHKYVYSTLRPFTHNQKCIAMYIPAN